MAWQHGRVSFLDAGPQSARNRGRHPDASSAGMFGPAKAGEIAAIDSHPGPGYALINGSDLPPGHAHSGWSRLQAKSCFVCEAAEVWVLDEECLAEATRFAQWDSRGGRPYMVRLARFV